MIIALAGVVISCFFMNLFQFTFENKYVNLVMLFVVYGIIASVVLLASFMCDTFFRKTLKKYLNIILSMVKRKK